MERLVCELDELELGYGMWTNNFAYVACLVLWG